KETKLDLLLSEGTRLGNDKMTMTEQQVHKKVKEIIQTTKNLVIANFPARDVDRLNSFFQACVESGRQLAIPTKIAYLIEELQQDKGLQLPSINEVVIYLQKAWWGHYEEDDYSSWEKKFLKANTITAEEVNKNQNKYVVFLDYFDLKELIDIKPKENSSYIYSISEPHDEEQMIDYERMQNWLKRFGLQMYTAHASGHASGEEIKEIVKLIDAKKAIPIHTEHPLLFKRFSNNVILPEYGKSIDF
ncbi:MAG: MBL fold metallo-hydrolase RNA specificity domain-containing protein, partial [Fervidobacterium sp.]